MSSEQSTAGRTEVGPLQASTLGPLQMSTPSTWMQRLAQRLSTAACRPPAPGSPCASALSRRCWHVLAGPDERLDPALNLTESAAKHIAPPALACIVGARRRCTAPMISSEEIPSR